MGGAVIQALRNTRKLTRSATQNVVNHIGTLNHKEGNEGSEKAQRHMHLPHLGGLAPGPWAKHVKGEGMQSVENAVKQLSTTMPIVPQRKLTHIWEMRERWRGFVLFCITALLWAWLQHRRVDAMFAYNTCATTSPPPPPLPPLPRSPSLPSTLSTSRHLRAVHTHTRRYRVYELGETIAAMEAGYGDLTYRDITTTRDLSLYLEAGLMRTMAAMASTADDAICPNCRVGLTPMSGDMYNLELTDFICSDFDSKAGSSNYPSRDCVSDDAAWAAAPSIYSAPCCANNTLAVLSLLLMADYAIDGPAESSFEALQAIASDPVQFRTVYERWTLAQISPGSVRGGSDEADHLIQIVVSRDERMAGVGFKAAFVDQGWFPGVLTTWQEIWSQRYDLEHTGLLVAFLFFISFDAAHELSDVGYEIQYLYKTALMTTRTFEGLSLQHRIVAVFKKYFLSGHSLFLLLIEVPSIVLPVLLELLRATGSLTVIEFNLMVAVTLAILLARFFQEGQVIVAFQLLVLTMTKATQQLFNFMLIMVMILLVATEMHVTIFGVYTDLYDSQLHAFLGTFNAFANGLNFDNNSKDIKNSEVGYIFIYLFASLVLLLVLSQFFIAILVSAWDAAAEQEKELEARQALPPGFRKAPDSNRPWWKVWGGRVVFLLFGYSIEANGWGTRIKHALNHSVRTRQWKLEQRKLQAEELFANDSAELTRAEENELFLFEHGIASAAELRLALRESGLSDTCISWIIGYYLPPQKVLDAASRAYTEQENPDGRGDGDSDACSYLDADSSVKAAAELSSGMQGSIEAVVSVLADDERRKRHTAPGESEAGTSGDGSQQLATSDEVGAVAANVSQLMRTVEGLVQANSSIVSELRRAQTALAQQGAPPPGTPPRAPGSTDSISQGISELKKRTKKRSSRPNSTIDTTKGTPPSASFKPESEPQPVVQAPPDMQEMKVYPPAHSSFGP